MNATRWASLTEFVKHLGKEGLCRVEEKDDGLFIAWIDCSPEALLRAANTQSKKNADAAEQRREEKLIQAQIERAQRNATPPPTSTDLSIKPGSTTAFQIQPSRKEDASAKDRVKKPNVFKVAKATTKRKNTEVEKIGKDDFGNSEVDRFQLLETYFSASYGSFLSPVCNRLR